MGLWTVIYIVTGKQGYKMSSVGYICLTTRRNDQYQQYHDG